MKASSAISYAEQIVLINASLKHISDELERREIDKGDAQTIINFLAQKTPSVILFDSEMEVLGNAINAAKTFITNTQLKF